MDRQIHTKIGSRPIKSQSSLSDPHTNRMPFNKMIYQTMTSKVRHMFNKFHHTETDEVFESVTFWITLLIISL